MSDPFGRYSRYYDLLYQDKDYAAETAYVQSLIERFSDGGRAVLEIGSGTGKHATLLSAAGFDVTGVERSEEMKAAADRRVQAVTEPVSGHIRPALGRVRFVHGDGRTVRLNQSFDCVLSLFHVVSYQTSNSDVRAMFETAAVHLAERGIFIFDVWYGPAVLRLRPSVRIRRMEDDRTHVLRVAEPDMNLSQNVVEVDYTIIVTDKASGQVEELQETHRMRYFFEPELRFFAESAGMDVIHCEQWLDGASPSSETWGVTVVLQKRASRS